MMFASEKLKSSEVLLIRGGKDFHKYGDPYTFVILLEVFPSLFIELKGFAGNISLADYKAGIKYLRSLAKKYGVAIVADSLHLPKKDFVYNHGWWFLKE